ncbi:nodulation protein NfeD [Aestuariicella hydrocarbonica]|uniref:Nodulation protein NfeD n=1 Tax=Pseudomaricurvus hydrocarbonicus TaxID=1470433 RepID=A0A9E5JYN1_9GAMM|nr:NfeD family protein [Aestuariicella hydrocarbonica]NHO64577.1 nodulation protein NfeD [Aestuariicella hydrocarbonica]
MKSLTGLLQPGLIVLLLWCWIPAANAEGDVWLVDIQDAIGPATADHMVRGLEQAQQANAAMVILLIDTPGGLDVAMRGMIKAILAAEIPVVGYVTPQGARAASAGTYILYASHVAAMSPATNLGAATPVQMGAPSLPGQADKDPDQTSNPSPNPSQKPSPKPSSEGSDTSEGTDEGADTQASPAKARTPVPQPGSAMERKIINDAVAYIQGLATLRGRNAEWAERAVREGVSLPAEQALEMGVVDLVATSVEDLLEQLDGRQISLQGADYTFATQEIAIHYHPVDWRSAFLSVITNPNVAYMLMLIGVYGLIFEFSNPGVGLPGVLGAVCLLLAMYAFQVLPVSYAGLGLIFLGIGLMTAEAFAPSFGILGVGGIIAFVMGSIILMDTRLPGYQIAMPLIVGFAAFSACVLIFALGLVLRARRQKVVTGLSHMLGAQAEVEALHGDTAMVRLDGELWQVRSDEPLQVNDKVTVKDVDGVFLQVQKTLEHQAHS